MWITAWSGDAGCAFLFAPSGVPCSEAAMGRHMGRAAGTMFHVERDQGRPRSAALVEGVARWRSVVLPVSRPVLSRQEQSTMQRWAFPVKRRPSTGDTTSPLSPCPVSWEGGDSRLLTRRSVRDPRNLIADAWDECCPTDALVDRLGACVRPLRHGSVAPENRSCRTAG